MVRKQSEKMRSLFGILGYPLTHSLSPKVWNRYFARKHRRYRYIKLEIPLGNPLPNMDAYCGLNITSPWKETIVQHVPNFHPLVSKIQAANTLVWKPQKGWVAYNTDVEGFLLGLQALSIVPGKALILGTGGAARAAAVALDLAGFKEIFFVSRCPHTKSFPWPVIGYRDLDKASVWEGTDLVVQATPLSWYDQAPPVSWERVPRGVAGYEMTYGRWTPFLEAMHTRGPVVDGTLMLLGQALESGKIWLGSRFDPECFEAVFYEVVPLLPKKYPS